MDQREGLYYSNLASKHVN